MTGPFGTPPSRRSASCNESVPTAEARQPAPEPTPAAAQVDVTPMTVEQDRAERLAQLHQSLPTVDAEDLRDGLARFLDHLAEDSTYADVSAHGVVSFLTGWLALPDVAKGDAR